MRYTRLLILVLVGCSTPAGSDGWRRTVGWVDPTLSSIQAVIAPPEVVAGRAFAVTVNTLGSSSCTRADGASVKVEGRVAEITPYDQVAPPNTPCTRDLRSFPRQVSITFATAGEAVIRVNRRRPNDGEASPYEQTIIVR